MLTSDLPLLLTWMKWWHIATGILAVAIFIIPLVTAKGGRIHIRSGWVFILAMGFIALSTFLIGQWRCFFDPRRSFATVSYSVFLMFMAVALVTAIQQGLLALKFKTQRNPNLMTAGLPVLLLTLSIGMAGFGIWAGRALFTSFAVLNSLLAMFQLRYWRTPLRHGREWWFYHLVNMFYCSTLGLIAATIETMTRVQHVPIVEPLWIWWTPVAIMGTWMTWFILRFRRRFRQNNG